MIGPAEIAELMAEYAEAVACEDPDTFTGSPVWAMPSTELKPPALETVQADRTRPSTL